MKEGNSYFLKDEYESIVAFSIKEVARMLQLPPSTIFLYCKEGLLPCFKVRISTSFRSQIDSP